MNSINKPVISLLLIAGFIFFRISDAKSADIPITYTLEASIEMACNYAPILNAGAARLCSA